MSTQNHASAGIVTDALPPANFVPAARIVDGGISQIHANEPGATESAESTEGADYRHVSLPTAGTTSVRYSRIEPLMPRRFAMDDDLS
jgi:hypothetical protein